MLEATVASPGPALEAGSVFPLLQRDTPIDAEIETQVHAAISQVGQRLQNSLNQQAALLREIAASGNGDDKRDSFIRAELAKQMATVLRAFPNGHQWVRHVGALLRTLAYNQDAFDIPANEWVNGNATVYNGLLHVPSSCVYRDFTVSSHYFLDGEHKHWVEWDAGLEEPLRVSYTDFKTQRTALAFCKRQYGKSEKRTATLAEARRVLEHALRREQRAGQLSARTVMKVMRRYNTLAENMNLPTGDPQLFKTLLAGN